MEALVHQIFVIRIEEVVRAGLLSALFHEAEPAAHHVIVLFEDRFIPVRLVQRPGNKDAGVAPAGRALEHVGDHAPGIVDGRDVAHQSVLPLLETALAQPLAQDGRAVGQKHRRRGENARVARPARALARGAVGRDVAEIRAHAPQAVEEKAVHIGAAAFEKAGPRHLGIDGDGRELRLGKVGVRLDLRIAEAEDRKVRLVDVFSVPADVDELLRNAVFVAVAGIKILLGKVAVFVQRLAVPERELLPRLRADADLRIAGEILAEVDHPLAVRRGEETAGKALLLEDRHALGRGKVFIAEVAHGDAVPVADLLASGVIGLALLQIVFAHRPALAGLPALVAYKDRSAADLKLAEQGEIRAVIVAQPVDADAAAIPAVAERDDDLVPAHAQEVRDVIGLHRESLFIGARPGREDEVPYPTAVDHGLIQAVAGDVKDRVLRLLRRKAAAQDRGGLPLVLIVGQLGVDPLRLPGGGQFVSHHSCLKPFR